MGIIRWGASGKGSLRSRRTGGSTTGASFQITTASLANAVVGTSYSASLTTSGGVGTVLFDLEAAFPNSGRWIALPVSNLVGTPQYAETSTLIIRATDSAGHTATKTLTLTSVAVGILAFNTSSTLPGAMAGSFYAFQLIGQGGSPPYTFSWPSSQPWQITADGWVEGTPISGGAVAFTGVTLTDSLGATVSKNFSLTVSSGIALAGYDATLGYLTLPPATVGVPYSHQLIGYGGSIWTQTGSLPPGLSMSPSGLISGTPSAAGNLNASVQLSAAASTYKFSPGQGMLSDNRNGSPSPYGSGGNKGEIDVLAACVTGGFITGTTCPAYYQATYTWNNLEYSQNVYTGIQGIIQDFLYLQSKCPGAHFIPGIIWFTFVNNTNISAPVNGDVVPDYVLNSPVTYGAGPNGQGGYGWSQWSGTNGILCAAMWNANVKNRILALVQAIANTVIPDGQGFTFDTHPLIEGIQDVSELSLDFVSGGVNGTYSPSAFYTQYNNYVSTAATYLPHTQFIPYIASYGLSSDPGDVPLLADLNGAITNAANTTGVGISNADTGITFGPSGDTKTWGQHLLSGDTTSNTGSTWSIGAGVDLRDKAGYCAVFQSPDYSNIGSGGYPARLLTLYNGAVALKSRYMLWDIQDETNPSLGYGFFTQYVLPFIQAHSTVTTTRPTNLP